MADTLSRKHRMRQQEQRKNQQQQVLLYDKENRRELEESYGVASRQLGSNNNNKFYHNHFNHNQNNNNNNNNENQQQEEFRVYSFVDSRQEESRRFGSGSNHNHANNGHNNAKVLNGSNQFDFINRNLHHNDDDEELSIVYTTSSPASKQASADLASAAKHRGHHDSNGSSKRPHCYVGGATATDCSTTDHSSSSTAQSNGGDTISSSSGFQSYGSGEWARAPPASRRVAATTTTTTNGSHHRLAAATLSTATRDNLRHPSKVIDDLNRLLVDVGGRGSTVSPSESYISMADSTLARDSTLTRGKEFDYSTLCRDEFSSFIAVESKQFSPNGPQAVQEQPPPLVANSPAIRVQRSGPVLVGVHENTNGSSDPLGCRQVNEYSRFRASRWSADEDEEEEDEQASSASSFSAATSSGQNGPASMDKELMLADQFQRCHDSELSRMLDLYLGRVDSLLRLSRGDKSVSMDDAFGAGEINISDEHRTAIEFAPLRRPNSTRVVQEVKTVELTIDDCDDDDEDMNEMDERERQRVADESSITATNIVTSDFRSLLAGPQTSAQLNWGKLGGGDGHAELPAMRTEAEREAAVSCIDSAERRRWLEESLLARLLADGWTTSGSCDLVNTVRRHVSEFIESYSAYQKELKANTSFAQDWHQNWLFACKRMPDEDGEESVGAATVAEDARAIATFSVTASGSLGQQAKRARMGNKGTPHPPLDLIKYSTLILSRCKPVKLTYLRPEPELEQEFDLDGLYEAQEDQISELYSLAMQTSQEVDVCRLLLLCDTLDDEDSSAGASASRKRAAGSGGHRGGGRGRRALAVSYSSSSVPAQCDNQFRFSAYGYLFELPIVMPTTLAARSSASKLVRLRESILSRLRDLLSSANPWSSVSVSGSSGGGRTSSLPEQQVRFLVNVTNVELANKLPVIQFCAKVSGWLPISVRWFRAADNDDELSDVGGSAAGRARRRKSLRLRDLQQWPAASGGGGGQGERFNADSPHAWPLAMQANYDFEYQTEWSSWFRFRRCQDDVLFEIREPSLEFDYNQTYRCVIQNWCSRSECSFSLTRRQLEGARGQQQRRRQPAAEQPEEDTRSRQAALLRTWSQRTLHKPVPSEKRQRDDDDGDNDGYGEKMDAAAGAGERQLQRHTATVAVGRRSTTTTTTATSFAAAECDEDKFGKDFPYHPANLLKRLEENKFCVKGTLKGKQQLKGHQQSASSPLPPKAGSPTTSGATPPTAQIRFADSFEPLGGQPDDHDDHDDERTLPSRRLGSNDDDDDDEQQARTFQTPPEAAVTTAEAAAGQTSRVRGPPPPLEPKPRLRPQQQPAQAAPPKAEPAERLQVSRSTEHDKLASLSGANGVSRIKNHQLDQSNQRPQLEGQSTAAAAGATSRPALQADKLDNLQPVDKDNDNANWSRAATAKTAGRAEDEAASVADTIVPRRANVKSLISRFSLV